MSRDLSGYFRGGGRMLMAFSLDGRFSASVCGERTIQMQSWDAHTGAVPGALHGHARGVRTCRRPQMAN